MNKTWEFTDETKVFDEIEFRRIRATVDFTLKCGFKVAKGEVGGWVEKDTNLCDGAWVYGDAMVYGNARVSDNARVYGNAVVYGNARVRGNAIVSGNAWVAGDAQVKSSEDYCVFKNTWSSFRWFTYTRSNKKWAVGCFYGTGKELVEKAYKDSELSGRCYEAIVKAQDAIELAKESEVK